METSELKIGDWVLYNNNLYGQIKHQTITFIELKGYNVAFEKRLCKKITEEEAMLWKLQS